MGIYQLVEVEEVKGLFWISKDQAAVEVGDVRIIHELKRDSQYDRRQRHRYLARDRTKEIYITSRNHAATPAQPLSVAAYKDVASCTIGFPCFFSFVVYTKDNSYVWRCISYTIYSLADPGLVEDLGYWRMAWRNMEEHGGDTN